MDIRSFTKQFVQDGVQSSKRANIEKHIRVIFSPTKIVEKNFKQVSELYGAIYGEHFESVVIIEDSEELLKKRLPMASNEYFTTPFGDVQVSDKYRNEFCDEEDDLYIDDAGFNQDMSLFHQLMMLQSTIENFDVVSIQISKDERPAIVRELAYVISELHDLRNTLFVFCCDLSPSDIEQFNRIQSYINENDKSNLLNSVFSDESAINGRGSFTCGIFVTLSWGLELEFIRCNRDSKEESLLAGIAYNKLF
ncbi:AmmeMemoRadiSam system protein B [bacterium]|nr:MAG: AmmeMemoRadiSam system protein B [bacterium]